METLIDTSDKIILYETLSDNTIIQNYDAKFAFFKSGIIYYVGIDNNIYYPETESLHKLYMPIKKIRFGLARGTCGLRNQEFVAILDHKNILNIYRQGILINILEDVLDFDLYFNFEFLCWIKIGDPSHINYAKCNYPYSSFEETHTEELIIPTKNMIECNILSLDSDFGLGALWSDNTLLITKSHMKEYTKFPEIEDEYHKWRYLFESCVIDIIFPLRRQNKQYFAIVLLSDGQIYALNSYEDESPVLKIDIPAIVSQIRKTYSSNCILCITENNKLFKILVEKNKLEVQSTHLDNISHFGDIVSRPNKFKRTKPCLR